MFVAIEMTTGMPYKKRGIFIPTYVQVMMEVLGTYNTLKKIPLSSKLINNSLWNNSPKLRESLCFYEDMEIPGQTESIINPLFSSSHWSYGFDIFLHSYSLYIELLHKSIKRVCTFTPSSGKIEVVMAHGMKPLWRAPFFVHIYPVVCHKEFSKKDWQTFIELAQQPLPPAITCDFDGKRIPLSFKACIDIYRADVDAMPTAFFDDWSMEQCPSFLLIPSEKISNVTGKNNEMDGKTSRSESSPHDEASNNLASAAANNDEMGSKSSRSEKVNNKAAESSNDMDSKTPSPDRAIAAAVDNSESGGMLIPIPENHSSDKEPSNNMESVVANNDAMCSKSPSPENANEATTSSHSVTSPQKDKTGRLRMPPIKYKPDDFRNKNESPGEKRRQSPGIRNKKKRKTILSENEHHPGKKPHTKDNSETQGNNNSDDGSQLETEEEQDNLSSDNESQPESDESVVYIDRKKYESTKKLLRDAAAICKKDDMICDKMASAIQEILKDAKLNKTGKNMEDNEKLRR